MVFTSACAPTRRHWCTALCSLSMGRIGTLRSRAAAVRISPAATMHSLLARPTGFPARMAACVASSPATPTMAETTKSAFGSVEQATVPSVPWTTSTPVMPACRKPLCQNCGQFFSGQRDDLRPPARSLREGLIDVASCGQRGHAVALGKLLDDGESALADGAGGAENGESFQCRAECLGTMIADIALRLQ